MRAAIYARVSTHDQADSGTSLQTQVEAARAPAAGRDYEVIEQYVIRDDASGTNLERPGLWRVSEGAAAGAFDVLIAYTLDRLYRPKEAGDEWRVFAVLDQLRQSGVTVEFVDPTIPTGRGLRKRRELPPGMAGGRRAQGHPRPLHARQACEGR